MRRFPDELPEGHPDRHDLAAVARRLDVPGSRIVLSPSMDDYIAEAMARRPTLVDRVRQQALTDTYLRPVLPGLMRLLLRLRAELDPALRATRPIMNGAPYPLGQCLEITLAVQARLEDIMGDVRSMRDVATAETRALAALRAFRDAGGLVRRVWGDLRGAYFQNALIVGVLYVDVANDTVVVTKPPVEILPFAEAGISPIADFEHFARIAGRYWRRWFAPNHILPELAPYMPFLQVAANGVVSVGPVDSYMLALTLANGFAPSLRVLDAPLLNLDLFAGVAEVARGGPIAVAASPEAGRAAALAACRAGRISGRTDATALNRAILAAHDVNRRLAGVRVLARAMSTVTPELRVA